MDLDVKYVQRNAVVVARSGFIARGAQGEHPIFVGNGFGGDVAESNYMRQNPLQDVYPDVRAWPKTPYVRFSSGLTPPFPEWARRDFPPPRAAMGCGGPPPLGTSPPVLGWCSA